MEHAIFKNANNSHAGLRKPEEVSALIEADFEYVTDLEGRNSLENVSQTAAGKSYNIRPKICLLA